MEIHSMHTGKPKSSKVYIFGSFIRGTSPDDIDILIVYDPRRCAPRAAVRIHGKMIRQIARAVALEPHVLLLTYEEEKTSSFIRDTCALELDALVV
jgi:predicted nucleotidyltransferase